MRSPVAFCAHARVIAILSIGLLVDSALAQPRAAELACGGLERGQACQYPRSSRTAEQGDGLELPTESVWGHCFALEHWRDGDGSSGRALLCLEDGGFVGLGAQRGLNVSNATAGPGQQSASRLDVVLAWVSDGGWMALAGVAACLCCNVCCCLCAASRRLGNGAGSVVARLPMGRRMAAVAAAPRVPRFALRGRIVQRGCGGLRENPIVAKLGRRGRALPVSSRAGRAGEEGGKARKPKKAEDSTNKDADHYDIEYELQAAAREAGDDIYGQGSRAGKSSASKTTRADHVLCPKSAVHSSAHAAGKKFWEQGAAASAAASSWEDTCDEDLGHFRDAIVVVVADDPPSAPTAPQSGQRAVVAMPAPRYPSSGQARSAIDPCHGRPERGGEAASERGAQRPSEELAPLIRAPLGEEDDDAPPQRPVTARGGTGEKVQPPSGPAAGSAMAAASKRDSTDAEMPQCMSSNRSKWDSNLSKWDMMEDDLTRCLDEESGGRFAMPGRRSTL